MSEEELKEYLDEEVELYMFCPSLIDIGENMKTKRELQAEIITLRHVLDETLWPPKERVIDDSCLYCDQKKATEFLKK